MVAQMRERCPLVNIIIHQNKGSKKFTLRRFEPCSHWNRTWTAAEYLERNPRFREIILWTGLTRTFEIRMTNCLTKAEICLGAPLSYPVFSLFHLRHSLRLSSKVSGITLWASEGKKDVSHCGDRIILPGRQSWQQVVKILRKSCDPTVWNGKMWLGKIQTTCCYILPPRQNSPAPAVTATQVAASGHI